jgi:dolichol-phosphate mannosyltransferase
MIERLYHKACNDELDIVCAKADFRTSDRLFHRLMSAAYYRVYDFLDGSNPRTDNMSFIIMRHQVAMEFRRLREQRRQFLSLVRFLGFRVGYAVVDHDHRRTGKSSYSFFKRVRHAFYGITSSTTRLLRIGIYIGFVFSTASFVFAVYIVLNKLWVSNYSAGWSSTITSIFFVGGLIMIILGILGIYLETIFFEVKNRPVYVVRETVNLPEVRSASTWRSVQDFKTVDHGI